MDKLNTWVNKKLNDKGWNYSELARRSKLSTSSVSAVMTNQRNPGLDFCVGIALAFNESGENVLRLAGLLPPISQDAIQEEKILYSFRHLSPEEQDLAIAAMRGMAQHKDNQ